MDKATQIKKTLAQLRAWRNIERHNKPITAYRAWTMGEVDSHYMLQSVVKTFWWEGPHVTADIKPDDAAKMPSRLTRVAGLYLVKHEYLAETLANYKYSGACVVGKGECWGRVIQYKKGYRAEHFMIRELYLPHGIREVYQKMVHICELHHIVAESFEDWKNRVIADLEERYKCPVLLGWPDETP